MGALKGSKVDDTAGRVGLIDSRRVEDYRGRNLPAATLPRQPTLAAQLDDLHLGTNRCLITQSSENREQEQSPKRDPSSPVVLLTCLGL